MKHRIFENLGEQIFSEKLENGLTVFVVPKPGFHKKYAVFAANYGGVDRRFNIADKWIDTPKGVAHFLEHKLFDTENGENALELLSANGASPNAYTSNDMTAYYFECGNKFEENLEVLLNFVSIPYFTLDSVEKEQGIIAQEICMVEDDPDYNLYYGLIRSLFKHSPIRDSVAGTVESIREITAETLYECHKVFYNPSNMALCVVGDIKPEEIVALANKTLTTSKGNIPKRDYGEEETLLPVIFEVEKNMDISLPLFNAGLKMNFDVSGDKMLKHELISYLALDLLMGSSSPLYQKLYSDGNINADFGFSVDSIDKTAYIVFGGEARDPYYVFNEVKKEVSRITKSGIDAKLLARIKKANIGSTIRAYNSFSAIAASVIEGHFRGFDSYQTPKVLESITANDILEFIKTNVIADRMAISVIKPLTASKAEI